MMTVLAYIEHGGPMRLVFTNRQLKFMGLNQAGSSSDGRRFKVEIGNLEIQVWPGESAHRCGRLKPPFGERIGSRREEVVGADI